MIVLANHLLPCEVQSLVKKTDDLLQPIFPLMEPLTATGGVLRG